jgi:hypothetical protein
LNVWRLLLRCLRKPEPYVHREPSWITNGLKGFPECEECQCYPECRIDCPDNEKCLERLGYK